MPTGYTSVVEGGEVRDLATFALRCAHSMFVELRDTPVEVSSIPEEFEVNYYYTQKAKKARDKVLRLESMTKKEVVTAAGEANDEVVRTNTSYREECETIRRRYESMLVKIEAWVPPSEEHEELKEFMRQQIQESIVWDCPDSPFQGTIRSSTEWHQGEMDEALDCWRYYLAEEHKENARVEKNNLWLRQLRASLPEEEVNKK